MSINGVSIMAAATERIVVQTSAEEKRKIVAKAKELGVNISELMRRGAVDYRPSEADRELEALVEAALKAATRAGAAIDDALVFIDKSNRRIAAMESKSSRGVARKAR
jgi:hypothetical protein